LSIYRAICLVRILCDVLISLAVTCDQQRSAVGPVIHIVLRPSKGRLR